jgi:hypothetical protein
MASARAAARHRSVYRGLLVLYPRSFRRDYAAPMAQVFGDQLRDVGSRAWLRAAPDLIRTVPTQRIEATMQRLSSGGRVVVLAVLVLAGAAATIGIGGGAVPAVAIALGVVLVAKRGMFDGLTRGERAPLRHAVTQTWWAPIAALLGVAMFVFAIGTVFEAHNLGGRVFGSTLMFVFGATMLLGLTRRPFARETGNAMILVATVPAFPFFWVVIPTVVAIVIWVGVLASGFSDAAAVEPAR